MKRVFIVILLLFLVNGIVQADTGEKIAEKLKEKGLSPEMVVVIVSMLPIVELRGALPIGINLFKMPLWKTLVLAIIGNMIPIFLVVLMLEKAITILGRFKLFKRFFDWLFARTRSKSGSIAKYKFWGLAMFVGIPLPGTGAWTGSIASVAMAMPYGRSLLSIFVGVLMAAAVVTLLCLLGKWGAIIASVVLIGALAKTIISAIRTRGKV